MPNPKLYADAVVTLVGLTVRRDRGGRVRAPRVTALLAAALISGCGGDDANTRPTGALAVSATPGSQFVAQAESICKDANEQETAAGATGIDWIHSDLFSDAKFLERFTAVGRSALADLRRLTPPAADEERFATALAAIDTMLRGLETQIARLRAGKDVGNSLLTYERGYTDLVAAGGPLGFTECLGIVL